MKTKFENIVVEIDDEKYEVSFTFATAKQKEELDALSKADEDAVENFVRLDSKLKMLEDKKSVNAQLIPLLDGSEKLEALKEQKTLLTEIEKLAPKVKKAAEVQMTYHVDEKRFEYLVGGKDKERLQSDLEKNDIPLNVVMKEIINGVAKAKEKK